MFFLREFFQSPLMVFCVLQLHYWLCCHVINHKISFDTLSVFTKAAQVQGRHFQFYVSYYCKKILNTYSLRVLDPLIFWTHWVDIYIFICTGFMQKLFPYVWEWIFHVLQKTRSCRFKSDYYVILQKSSVNVYTINTLAKTNGLQTLFWRLLQCVSCVLYFIHYFEIVHSVQYNMYLFASNMLLNLNLPISIKWIMWYEGENCWCKFKIVM